MASSISYSIQQSICLLVELIIIIVEVAENKINHRIWGGLHLIFCFFTSGKKKKWTSAFPVQSRTFEVVQISSRKKKDSLVPFALSVPVFPLRSVVHLNKFSFLISLRKLGKGWGKAFLVRYRMALLHGLFFHLFFLAGKWEKERERETGKYASQ